jgi:hypothetical protein
MVPFILLFLNTLLNMPLNVTYGTGLYGKPWKLTEAHYTSGSVVAQWLRCCATNRKVAGSIPDGVIGIFH